MQDERMTENVECEGFFGRIPALEENRPATHVNYKTGKPDYPDDMPLSDCCGYPMGELEDLGICPCCHDHCEVVLTGEMD